LSYQGIAVRLTTNNVPREPELRIPFSRMSRGFP